MAKKIFAFNLKMNKPDINIPEYIKTLEQSSDIVYACVPYVYLNEFQNNSTCLKFGAQNVSEFKNGSHTGEISAKMLSEFGAKICIVGHSERRKNGETSYEITEKINRLLENKITPIICVGEEKEMNFKKAIKVVKKLLDELNLPKKQKDKLIIAYEPIWAIGTGKVPSLEHIKNMCKFIKEYLKNFNLSVKVLYGGSYNENNAPELNTIKGVDGFLIGGASLKILAVKQILNLN